MTFLTRAFTAGFILELTRRQGQTLGRAIGTAVYKNNLRSLRGDNR